MRRIIVLSFILSVNLYFCQSTVLYNLHNKTLTSNAINKIGVTDLNNNDYVGSPFLENNFSPSIIEGENGQHLLRYNIYNDEIILQKDDNYFKIPKNSNLDYFIINNKYKVRLVNDTYYIQTSSEKNKFVILKKENIKFTQGKISENGYGQNTSSKFTKQKADYFLYNLESKKLIPFKKEDFKSVFVAKENEINQFFKTSRLKIDDDYNEFLKIVSN
ncbi:hypothetical protein NAL32_01955 [Chryseobacterium sp. Ch-15]|uniref:Uncharacterized protein n=1 Tax=Chryseobacterium muglaense TaxID=2893752 RepID=A0A9Q3UTK5_9FLAO|nr:hypothetical protein [Chryseobacterium muglaense]MBD3903805.1 hypothetical protein [Chryseobacterium muglaense]MCC9034879.1 hypothetical protein [Chryseobacterium muglaense]MCM2553144.1 hypothetical protein [Chryseobacterium muglaense]